MSLYAFIYCCSVEVVSVDSSDRLLGRLRTVNRSVRDRAKH